MFMRAILLIVLISCTIFTNCRKVNTYQESNNNDLDSSEFIGKDGFSKSEAEWIGARVRWQLPRDVTPARTHLFLRVHLPEGDWLTDVGLGAASLTCAIPLEFDREFPTPHETRRLVREEGKHFHQLWTGTEWTDCCEFTLDEMHPIDCEIANWWTSASPKSHFKGHVTVGRAGPDGTRKAIRQGEFIHRRGAEILHREPIASPEQLLKILREHFDLSFPEGTRFL